MLLCSFVLGKDEGAELSRGQIESLPLFDFPVVKYGWMGTEEGHYKVVFGVCLVFFQP